MGFELDEGRSTVTTKARVNSPQSDTGNLIKDSALGLVPETLPHYLDLTVAIWDAGPLSPSDIELARLRNANHVGCVMCQAVRYDIAVADGLTEDLVDQVSNQGIQAGLPERQELIVRFVDWYVLSPSAHDADLKRCLDEQFSEAEQVHLALLMAYFNGFSRCAVSLGGMPDSMPRMEISVPR
ncbi:carboxymuconolactone decarboxylase family protein [Halieaceae bacterium IMCC8485]|jgi:alkylhydroperoxidase family enzyme|uniref:Carboxymuconolactone decarboxylase family protein n=1 Tax=Candidatus Seongchinamella marina TaxID=2518990 RepID=A0ABT3SRR6_9GAMM|nr:carboxymuconolactone decarboxylase family protein [Candidatus Seongchinamella marina]MCX2972559.1 carboxymuconolactone decarboxylase family protein [Candidatus Seongchinamella marina]